MILELLLKNKQPSFAPLLFGIQLVLGLMATVIVYNLLCGLMINLLFQCSLYSYYVVCVYMYL